MAPQGADASIAEHLSAILGNKEEIRQAIASQGVSIGKDIPLSQYPGKIAEISCDARQYTGAVCSGIPGVSPGGGTYTSVAPYDDASTCRYTAPSKSILGCASVTSQPAAYDGNWPASTYAVIAEAGYYIENNSTASATCTECPKDSYCTGGSDAPISCEGGFATSGTGAGAATDCARGCAAGDIAGSYAVYGTINQTQTPSAACELTGCAAQHYKSGNSCVSCANACGPASQACTPSDCAVANGECYYNEGSGVQSRSSDCENVDGNSLTSAACAEFGACEGALKHVTCGDGYTAQNQDTAGASCAADKISSATKPAKCNNVSYNNATSSGTMTNCTGGDVNGAEVSSFVLGGYCAPNSNGGSLGKVGTCSDCSPSNDNAGSYCWCQIHSVNGVDVVPSSQFVFMTKYAGPSYTCVNDCTGNCTNTFVATTYKDFQTALFTAIGK